MRWDCVICRAFYVGAFACVYLRQWSLSVCLLVAIWSITTAASRAAMGRHYVGDVCAGIPLGLLTVAIVTQVKNCSTWGVSFSESKVQHR